MLLRCSVPQLGSRFVAPLPLPSLRAECLSAPAHSLRRSVAKHTKEDGVGGIARGVQMHRPSVTPPFELPKYDES